MTPNDSMPRFTSSRSASTFSGRNSRCDLVRFAIAIIASIVAAAAPAFGQGASDEPVVLRPGDRLAWQQTANTTLQLRSYVFVAYIDGTNRTLLNAHCESAGEPFRFDCVSEFPPLEIGRHHITVAAMGDAESDESNSIYVERAAASAPMPPAIDRPPIDDGEQRQIDLYDPVDVARVGDGLIVVGEKRGRLIAVHYDHRGAVQTREWSGPSLQRLLSLQAVESRFLFALYASGTSGSLVRYTITPYGLRDAVTILEELPVREGGSAVLRLGPDGSLLIALPAQGGGVDGDAGSWVGKVLRFTPDGTLPPGASSLAFGRSVYEPKELIWRGTEPWLLGSNKNGVDTVVAIRGTLMSDAAERGVQLPAIGARTIRADGDGGFYVDGDLPTLRVSAEGRVSELIAMQLDRLHRSPVIRVIEDANVVILCTTDQLVIRPKLY
jgi:hypothetical protein